MVKKKLTNKQRAAFARATSRPALMSAMSAPRKVAARQRQSQSFGEMRGSPSQCLIGYLKVQCDPFTEDTACVPAAPSTPSQKLSCWSKGTLKCGTLGFGFLQVSTTPTNNTSSFAHISRSDSTLAVAETAVTGTGVLTDDYNSPYAEADFGTANDKKAYRVVACGIRVRYIGTELNRGGLIFAFQHPDHQTTNALAVTDAQKFDGVVGEPVDREWHAALWTPINDDEITYRTTMPAHPTLAIMIEGSPDDIYAYEAYLHVEVIGADVPKTPSENDLIGMQALSGWVHEKAQSSGIAQRVREAKKRERPNNPWWKQVLSEVLDYGAKNFTKFAAAAVPFVV